MTLTPWKGWWLTTTRTHQLQCVLIQTLTDVLVTHKDRSLAGDSGVAKYFISKHSLSLLVTLYALALL